MKESEGNVFNPIFKRSVQGRKHPGSCVFAELDLSYRKPKHIVVVQNEKNVHENPYNSHNYYDENHDGKELYQNIRKIVKGAHNETQHQNNAHTKTDCDGVQLTNAQCHMIPISILWYREVWTIYLKYTWETKQGRLTVSYQSLF